MSCSRTQHRASGQAGTKQRIKCHSRGCTTGILGKLKPVNPEYQAKHSTTESDSQNFIVSSEDEIGVKENSTKYIQ